MRVCWWDGLNPPDLWRKTSLEHSKAQFNKTDGHHSIQKLKTVCNFTLPKRTFELTIYVKCGLHEQVTSSTPSSNLLCKALSTSTFQKPFQWPRYEKKIWRRSSTSGDHFHLSSNHQQNRSMSVSCLVIEENLLQRNEFIHDSLAVDSWDYTPDKSCLKGQLRVTETMNISSKVAHIWQRHRVRPFCTSCPIPMDMDAVTTATITLTSWSLASKPQIDNCKHKFRPGTSVCRYNFSESVSHEGIPSRESCFI